LRSALPNEWAPEPCLDLVNTQFNDHLGSGKVNDRLPLTEWRRAFLGHWGYRVEDPDDRRAVARLKELRGVLRAALEAYGAGDRIKPQLLRALEAEINRAPFVVRIAGRSGEEALVLQRTGRAWDAVTADIATSAMRLIAERRRVKVCSNPSCSWMFEDRSKSGSRRWCDASICGSLINVRRYRRMTSRR
jgi:predicted RNA-binding Zn ribbon-like protein